MNGKSTTDRKRYEIAQFGPVLFVKRIESVDGEWMPKIVCIQVIDLIKCNAYKLILSVILIDIRFTYQLDLHLLIVEVPFSVGKSKIEGKLKLSTSSI